LEKELQLGLPLQSFLLVQELAHPMMFHLQRP
jgi:hypothetical protein